MVPFPQIAHDVYATLQTASVSSWQVKEQPSPEVVPPSSHYSFVDSTIEFPHKVQTEANPGTVVQFQPETTVQSAKHPSKLRFTFPSSHSSGESFCPFPQIAQEPGPYPTQ